MTTDLVSAEFYVSWQGHHSVHRDWRYFPRIDCWRDLLPGNLGERIQDEGGGLAEVEVEPDVADLATDEVLPRRRDLPASPVIDAFRRRHLRGPYEGRFYPRGVLARVVGAGDLLPQDMHPFRVVSTTPDRVEVDLGHPLGRTPLKVGGRIVGHRDSGNESGGSCTDVLADLIGNGPGMQCPPPWGEVDFDQNDAYTREDPSPDDRFYEKPRMVHHTDERARAFVNRAYREAIGPSGRVLDLMSSWVSHLDGIDPGVRVTGLGMNREELAANPVLDDYVVHDLNQDPRLPWGNDTFDAVICTVSIEYITRPQEVFAEVARVLRSGGRFVVTLSDRWFPTKAIRIWSLLHPFERMGLILDYFRGSGRFGRMQTESWSGWPRPEDDMYYRVISHSDPVFAVQGMRL